MKNVKVVIMLSFLFFFIWVPWLSAIENFERKTDLRLHNTSQKTINYSLFQVKPKFFPNQYKPFPRAGGELKPGKENFLFNFVDPGKYYILWFGYGKTKRIDFFVKEEDECVVLTPSKVEHITRDICPFEIETL